MPFKSKSDYNLWMRQYRKRRRDYFNASISRTMAKKPEFYRAKWRRNAERLTDCYVRQLLSQGTKIKRSVWPLWLVKLKRKSIQLERKYGIHQNNRKRTECTN